MDSYFTRVAGFEAGINLFLTKPYQPEELILKVEELLKYGGADSQTSGKPKSKRNDSGSFERSLPKS
jgi:DNA-binding response OmpR family regulator